MKGIIDRFEGNIAVVELENRSMVNIDRSLLPPDSKEGDCIFAENGIYKIDTEETERRRKKIQSLMGDLFE